MQAKVAPQPSDPFKPEPIKSKLLIGVSLATVAALTLAVAAAPAMAVELRSPGGEVTGSLGSRR